MFLPKFISLFKNYFQITHASCSIIGVFQVILNDAQTIGTRCPMNETMNINSWSLEILCCFEALSKWQLRNFVGVWEWLEKMPMKLEPMSPIQHNKSHHDIGQERFGILVLKLFLNRKNICFNFQHFQMLPKLNPISVFRVLEVILNNAQIFKICFSPWSET